MPLQLSCSVCVASWRSTSTSAGYEDSSPEVLNLLFHNFAYVNELGCLVSVLKIPRRVSVSAGPAWVWYIPGWVTFDMRSQAHRTGRSTGRTPRLWPNQEKLDLAFTKWRHLWRVKQGTITSEASEGQKAALGPAWQRSIVPCPALEGTVSVLFTLPEVFLRDEKEGTTQNKWAFPKRRNSCELKENCCDWKDWEINWWITLSPSNGEKTVRKMRSVIEKGNAPFSLHA